MSEPSVEPTAPNPGPPEGGTTFTQEQVDQFVAAATKKANEEAAKYRVAAKEASQTEAEKVAAQLAAIQSELAQSKLEALRATIAGKHGISQEDAALLLTGTDEKTLNDQAQALAKLKPSGPRSPREGLQNPGKGSDDPLREFSAQLHHRD